MPKTLFKQFVEWGTALKRKIETDSLRAIRVQLMASYFLASILIFVLLGWLVSSIAFQQVYQTFNIESGSPAEQAYETFQQGQFERRAILVIMLLVTTYFLAEFAIRPARRAAELQKHFIAVASHELRTPLAVMKNMSEVALRNPNTLTHEKALRIITSNLEETNRLSETVQLLLSFATLKSQDSLPNMEEVALGVEIQRILGMFVDEIRDRHLKLSTHIRTDTNVYGNKVALEGLVTNLIKNAVQHAPDHGEIRVEFTNEADSKVRFLVSNTGERIPRKDIPFLFEPFFRGSVSKGSGFGLGLSIARQIAELHRARIHVRFDKKHGTTFAVFLATQPLAVDK